MEEMLLFASCHCSDPMTRFTLKEVVMFPVTPGKIVSMETQHLNELMNHSGTPQLRQHQCLVESAQGGGRMREREGSERHAHTIQRFGQSSVRDPGGRLFPKCSESKFGQGGSKSPADSTFH